MDYLIVIDMQNDFITGALANENTQKILPKIKKKIEDFKGTVVYVQTTHFGDYMDTQEAKYIPVMHCIDGTEGHKIEPSLLIPKNGQTPDDLIVVQKQSLGVVDNSSNRHGSVWRDIMRENPSSVEVCGTRASMSVICNAFVIKSLYHETPVKINENLITDLDDKSLNAALLVMKNSQVLFYKEDM